MYIYGAGISGCYLAALCENEGIKYKLYDKRSTPDCRCAWGVVDWKKFKKLYNLIDYNLTEYVLNKCNKVYTNVINFKYDTHIIDKRKLLSDMWKDIGVENDNAEKIDLNSFKENDYIIDATGYSRSILPKIRNDLVVPCYQIRCKTNLDDDSIYIFVSKDLLGYSWAFPVADEWHIGAGHELGLNESKKLILKLIKYFNVKIKEITCKCIGKIRHLPPSMCKPMYLYNNVNIFGVGEAIGTVSVIGGGNNTSVQSSKLLVDFILSEENYCDYDNKVIEYFDYIEKEYKVYYAILNRQYADLISNLKELVVNKNINYNIKLSDLISFIKVLNKFVIKKDLIDDLEVGLNE